MTMYYILYALGAFGATLSFVEDKKWGPTHRKVYLPIFLGILLILAAFRSSSTDRDYLNYLGWFELIAQGGLSWFDWIKDPAFVLISELVLKIGLQTYVGVLFVFVALALIGKLCFLRMATSERWLVLALYLMLCRFFLAQEMTAIRPAVAAPLMSICILLAFRRRIRAAVGIYLAAVAFHLSALVLLPVLVLLLLRVRFQSRWWIYLLIPTAAVSYLALRHFLESLAFDRLDVYLNDPDAAGVSVFLSTYFLERVLILTLVVGHFWKELTPEEHLCSFCCALGVYLQAALSFNGTLALRSAELFGLFDVILFLLPLKYLGRKLGFGYLVLIVLLGGVLFRSQLKVMLPYGWLFFSY